MMRGLSVLFVTLAGVCFVGGIVVLESYTHTERVAYVWKDWRKTLRS